MRISKSKIAFITMLCVLTSVVLVFDIIVLNGVLNSKVLWIYVSPLPSAKVVDVTDNPFRIRIMRYVNESIQAGQKSYITNDHEIEDFFTNLI